MSENLKESLSALMDDEADELELRRVLKAAADDESGQAIQSDWSRYHLVRDIMHNNTPRQASTSLLAGIQAVIADEASPRAECATDGRGQFVRTLSRALGQGAIAASVAFVVLFTAHNLHLPESAGVGSMADTQSGNASPSELTALNANVEYVESEFNRTVNYSDQDSGLDPQTRDRLRQAIQREFEQSSSPQMLRLSTLPSQE